MTAIFVSYRRKDAQPVTDHITDGLEKAGFDIFKDVFVIPGRQWQHEIESALVRCDVLIAVIGDDWLGHVDEFGQHRIHQDDDYVRYEVRAAIKRGIPLIPVLADAAHLPSSDALPEDIRGLVHRQAARVRPDPDFSTDMTRLIGSIRLLAPSRWEGTAIKLGYSVGKLEVFLRSSERIEYRNAVESVLQEISWLADQLGLAFNVERQHGVPGDMQLSTAGLRDDVQAAFEVGYHVGRFYWLALAFVATGLVHDNAVTDILGSTADLLPRAGLPTDLLAPVVRHWHGVSERISMSGALDPQEVNDAGAEADRIVDQLASQIVED